MKKTLYTTITGRVLIFNIQICTSYRIFIKFN